LAPNDEIDIRATGSVHLSLQGKGGVGKSPVASILAQYLNRKALAVRCIDWEPANKTLSQYKGLRPAPLPLLREGGIDQRAFDGLMEELLTPDGVFVVDSGASTFIPLWNYILQDTVHEVLRAAGKRLFVHTIITAGRALTDTIKGLLAIIEFAWSAAVMLLEESDLETG
jgi:hypothetical protein